MNDLMKYKTSEVRKITFAHDDVRARSFLLDRAEKEYGLGNEKGSALLFHAEIYLADRLKYQLDPDLERSAIPLPRRQRN